MLKHGGGGNIWRNSARDVSLRKEPRLATYKMVQFGVFWCIFGSDFVFKKFLKLPFLYENFKNIIF